MRDRTSVSWFLVTFLILIVPGIASGNDGTPDAAASPLEQRRIRQQAGAKALQELAVTLFDRCEAGGAGQEQANQAAIQSLARRLAKALQKLEAESAEGQQKKDVASALKEVPDGDGVTAKALAVVLNTASEFDAISAEVGTLSEELAAIQAATSLCSAYCGSAATHINVCAFYDDLDLARVAQAVDPVSTQTVLDVFEQAREGKLKTIKGKRRSRSGGALATGLLPPSLTTAEGATELAIRFATALGKLAVDRAKQEAVVWALGEIGTRFCGNDRRNRRDAALTSEVRVYWLPQLCRLTTEQNLASGFGAGRAMLDALVSAVESDAKNLPGAAAGLIIGLGYWVEDTRLPAEEAFNCGVPDSVPDDGACTRIAAVRHSTAVAVRGLLDGSDPVDEARTWSSSIDGANRVALRRVGDASADGTKTDGGRAGTSPTQVLEAPLAQLTACGVAVAAEFGAAPEGQVVLGSVEGQLPEIHRLVGALTSAPACWTLTGRGWPSADYRCTATDDESGEKLCTTELLALERAELGDVERLSSIIRLAGTLKQTQLKATDAWRSLLTVAARLRSVRARLSTAIDDAKGTGEINASVVATITKLGGTDIELRDFRGLLDEVQLDEVTQRLSVALDVAEELVAAADATAVLLDDIADPELMTDKLFPGLWVRASDGTARRPGWSEAVDLVEFSAHIDSFQERVADVQEIIGALRKVLAGDWATGTSMALAVAQRSFPSTAPAGAASAKAVVKDAVGRLQDLADKETDSAKKSALTAEIKAIKRLRRRTPRRALRMEPDTISRLGELVGLFTAILSAKDSDDIAVILEKTASPPGSWRRKQVEGSFTLSLGSHVGLYTAAEFRHGQYGVNRENGSPHWQAFTLAVPIGLDFAWGIGHRNSMGLFVPVIDPVAFVQYDVSESGRLPGPRPLTVLSPGLMARWGIFRTPMTLVAGYMFRPRLRTWEATINEPGADAHQLGIALAIDATFWNIVKR